MDRARGPSSVADSYFLGVRALANTSRAAALTMSASSRGSGGSARRDGSSGGGVVPGASRTDVVRTFSPYGEGLTGGRDAERTVVPVRFGESVRHHIRRSRDGIGDPRCVGWQSFIWLLTDQSVREVIPVSVQDCERPQTRDHAVR